MTTTAGIRIGAHAIEQGIDQLVQGLAVGRGVGEGGGGLFHGSSNRVRSGRRASQCSPHRDGVPGPARAGGRAGILRPVPPTHPPRWLFVCTANINRSPAAASWGEQLLAERFVAAEIRSAGTHAWQGAEAGAYTIDAMRELGQDLRAHRSQPLDPELLRWADEIVVMEPMHAETALTLEPSCEPRLRRLWTWIPGSFEEVPDPQGQDLDAHRAAVRLIGQALEVLVEERLAARRAARAGS